MLRRSRHPLLTPPSEFLAEYDWLPAVLESVLLAIAQSHQPPVMTSMAPYWALRHIFDSAQENATTGPDARSLLAGHRNLADWLRTCGLGNRPGVGGQGHGEKASIDERAGTGGHLPARLRELRLRALHEARRRERGGAATGPAAAACSR